MNETQIMEKKKVDVLKKPINIMKQKVDVLKMPINIMIMYKRLCLINSSK